MCVCIRKEIEERKERNEGENERDRGRDGFVMIN